jgi:hypothetical protein
LASLIKWIAAANYRSTADQLRIKPRYSAYDNKPARPYVNVGFARAHKALRRRELPGAPASPETRAALS